MTLDLTKPLMTRSGRQVLFIGRAPDPCDEPLVFAVRGLRSKWTVETYTDDGRFMAARESGWDIINAAPSATVHHIRDAVRLVPNNDCQGERS